MKLPTLDEFIIQHHNTRFPHNSYVRVKGFKSFYVRMGRRQLNGLIYQNVLDIANIEAKNPGRGEFTKLIKILSEQNITIYVENVMNIRFANKLLQMGFTKCISYGSEGLKSIGYDFPSFFLINSVV